MYYKYMMKKIMKGGSNVLKILLLFVLFYGQPGQLYKYGLIKQRFELSASIKPNNIL